MNKKTVRMLIGLAIGLVLSFVLIFAESMHTKKLLRDFFETLYNKTNVFLSSGINIYLSEAEDVRANDIKKRDGVKVLNSGDLSGSVDSADASSDRYKQFQRYVSKNIQGLNTSSFKSVTGKDAYRDIFGYYNSNGESILLEGTLLLIRKDPETNAELFYTCQDYKITDEFENILQIHESDYFDIHFHINGAYIKDYEFVPESIEYMDEDSEDHRYVPVYSLEKDRSTMESEGFEYYEIDKTFSYGDISDSEDFFAYCSTINEEDKNRIHELYEQAIKRGNIGNVIYEDKGPFAMEVFSVTEYKVPETDESYYAVSYEKNNSLYTFARKGSYPIPLPINFLLYALEFILIVTISLVTAGIINKKKGQK
ncbi:hypothetical protein SAMN02910369_02357 [Lachnospiraceae bacterium NE2001]|nr:hypothetical protein SAMN02910369_02357 [Lachnospiraceae bacterium NE2001]